MTDITGTQGDDTLDGTSGDDLIRGLGGNDIITGGDGNDTIEGGDGDDNISGGAGDDIIDGGAGRDIIDDFDGNDTVHGGLGNDVIYVGGGTNLIYGDEGDDLIIAQLVNEGVAESEIYAGDGNDEVRYQTVGGFGGSVDLGSGADLLVLGTEMQDLSIALGTGQDTIFLSGLISAAGGSATVTDFEAGDTGDRLDLSRIVQHDLFDYDGYANPFGTGHFTLVASGTGSAIEFRTDINYGPVFTLYFPNVSVGQFTAYNLGGYDPSGVTTDGPPINGTPNADTIDGTDLGETISGLAGDDTINGLGGNDTIIGGAGSDTLNGGDGDDLFIFDFSSEPGFDPSENPSLDAAINGGAGTDTIRVIGSVQGSDIVQFDVAADLPMTSIERLEFDGNSELLGTAAQIAAFEFVAASNLRITDAAHFDPSGGFAVTQLSLSNAGASADLSGPEVYVLNIVTGDGNDNIVGPDQAMTNPDPFNSDITIGIDVRGGDDVVVTGNFATRVLSAGGNNNFTGGTGNDTFILFGNGNNIVNGGAGNDEITFYDLGTSTGHGGDGDDVISIRFLDPTDVLSGGAGTDRMIVDTGGSFDDYDLTGVTLPSDFEIFEVQGQGNIIATTGQINQFDEFIVRYLTIADGGAVTLDHAPFQVHLSAEGNSIDLSGSSSSFTYVYGNLGRDIIIGGQSYNFLSGGAGDDELISFGGDDSLDGGDGVDLIIGGLGNDQIDGGSNVDTAVVSGNRAAYTVTQTSAGVFEVAGPDGTDTLTNVEYLQFDDQTMRLLPGSGVSVNFETADPTVYQAAMDNIRDFDGNALGGNGSWLRIGSADIDGDGDIDQILVNREIGRFATVGGTEDGLSYFSDHGWAGETRVVGIYIDPLVASGDVVAGGPNDSQRRFQNDLFIENINRVLGADDYDGDGLQEVYFALTDGTAYLHAYMHADGNIRYANYQSEQQVIDYLTANGFDSSTWADWFPTTAEPEDVSKAFVLDDLAASDFGNAPEGLMMPLLGNDPLVPLGDVFV